MKKYLLFFILITCLNNINLLKSDDYWDPAKYGPIVDPTLINPDTLQSKIDFSNKNISVYYLDTDRPYAYDPGIAPGYHANQIVR